MTIPSERTRAMVWAGAFLVELARNTHLPYEVRRTAVFVARHYPTLGNIETMAMLDAQQTGFWLGMLERPSKEDIAEWLRDYPLGPLTGFTHLALPPEPRVRAPRRKPEPGNQP